MQHVYYQRYLRQQIEEIERLLQFIPHSQSLVATRAWLLNELQRYQIAVFKR